MSDVVELQARRPALVFSATPAPAPRIYYLTPDHQVPSGGIRVIYRHVDILRSLGMDARVLHRRPGFRCRWFDNETMVTDVAAETIRPGDVLVVPEVEVDVLDDVPRGVRRVIFNQNSHLTWKRQPDAVRRNYTAGEDLEAVLCVSDHNRRMLRLAFPDAPVRRIGLSIDPAVFRPHGSERPRRIAYMPRRGRNDARQVLAVLEAAGLLRGWEVVALDGLSESEVARNLRLARIFLAFTSQEGFGLPAAEAMACGCYVIGNDGFGGREFFLPQFSTRVEAGDIVGFADAIGDTLRHEAVDADWCGERGRRASRFIHQEYSPERERGDLASFYGDLLAASGRSGARVG